MNRTLFDKIWDDHVVTEFDDGTCLLYIDRIFLHEQTGSVALLDLQTMGRMIRNPKQVFCNMDHVVDTFKGRNEETRIPGGAEFDSELTIDCSQIGPTVLRGTSPQDAIQNDGVVPDPDDTIDIVFSVLTGKSYSRFPIP